MVYNKFVWGKNKQNDVILVAIWTYYVKWKNDWEI